MLVTHFKNNRYNYNRPSSSSSGGAEAAAEVVVVVAEEEGAATDPMEFLGTSPSDNVRARAIFVT